MQADNSENNAGGGRLFASPAVKNAAALVESRRALYNGG